MLLPCVIDIEASGFGRDSYPIEVGYVREDGQAWCTLVHPEAGWTHWDDAAAQVHQIDRTNLLRSGRTARDVAERLNQDLGGRTVYCDGWAHDYPWLARLFDAAGLVPRFRLEPVTRLLDDARLARLDRLRAGAFTTLNIQRHRASSDARALQWAVGELLHAETDNPQ
jgi:hypothetical protein